MFDPQDIPLPKYSRLFREPLGLTELFNILPAWDILKSLPNGSGQPVMVIPGLTTNDASTAIIRTFLKSKNFNVYGWSQGVNIKYTPELEERLIRRLEMIRNRHGQRVTIIGWSLGGITMRLLASHAPEHIDQLIALGAPFANIRGKTRVNWWYKLLTGETVDDFPAEWAQQIKDQPLMPSTSIYSKTDGMVSWEYCMDWNTGPQTQNIEVYCNHLGFGMNPSVWCIVHDRLMQEEGTWEHFDVSRLQTIEKRALFHI